MKWKEFEGYCENLIYESLDCEKFKITPQYKKVYSSGTKCMDFLISERQGRKRY